MDRRKIDALNEQIDVAVICGDCCDLKILRAAGTGTADVLVAVTDDDESNIISAIVAKKLGCKQTISRCRKDIYTAKGDNSYASLVGIDLIINPEKLTAFEIAKLISTPGALIVENFAHGKVQLREVTIGDASPVCGKSLRDIGTESVGLIAGVSRGGEIFVPGGDTVIQNGDRLFVIGKPDRISRADRVFGRSRPGKKSVFILGAGHTGINLAKMLENDRFDVKMIERNMEKAESAADALRKTLVFHGDATDTNLLRDKDIASADVFIALSGDDEDNIITGLLARELGVRMCVVKVEKPEYVKIVEQLGIDLAVSPRLLGVNEALSFIRRGNFNSVSVLERDKAEMIEVRVAPQAAIAGRTLMESGLPRGTIIGAIVRGEEVIIPRGNDVVHAGDVMILFTVHENLPAIERMFCDSIR